MIAATIPPAPSANRSIIVSVSPLGFDKRRSNASGLNKAADQLGVKHRYCARRIKVFEHELSSILRPSKRYGIVLLARLRECIQSFGLDREKLFL